MNIIDTIRQNIDELMSQQSAMHLQAKVAYKSGHSQAVESISQ